MIERASPRRTFRHSAICLTLASAMVSNWVCALAFERLFLGDVEPPRHASDGRGKDGK